MSEARRAVEALATAHNTIVGVVHDTRRRVHRDDMSQHISDLRDQREAVESIHYLIRELAKIANAYAAGIRATYHGRTPTGDPWPDTVQQAADAADHSLSRLRKYLNQTPTWACRNDLDSLREHVRTLHRTTGDPS